jgi:hypothetical protein
MYGDSGDAADEGEGAWAVLTFDRPTTKEQRDGLLAVARAPFAVAEGAIDTWERTDGGAWARLDAGRTAEIRLVRLPRGDGVVAMSSALSAYRTGEGAFEDRETGGRVFDIDVTSTDPPSP